MIKGLAHVCFRVRNLESSIAFYRDKLGFTPAFDFTNDKGEKTGAYLRIGDRSFIELFVGEPQPVANGSYKHFCLEVDDIETTLAELKKRGVEVKPAKLGKDHSWQSWVTDPDGNQIELHGYTPQSWQAPWLK